ncbi:hypothetical protein HMPREF9243_0883 [Aerococcus sp. Group 1]|uniref:S8 family peptidase n=1 Tax=Aerococcus urinae (strain CCUG 59500 / ACS-120-V-Col10a) TaxID=2976812 RepID=UPI000200E70E|nr:S8 family peptidase [Aerococcus sp. Group 1]AEA01082.1 hypothetical protein HMPREF9243_0883 [Aerococcus sp. Group 1]
MNNILQLKGELRQQKASGKPGPSNIPRNKSVSLSHLEDLKDNLISVQNFWEREKLAIKPLITAYYTDVVAKSNRIKGLLYSTLDKNNRSIVGAKFSNEIKKKHVITYCVENEIISDAIKNISKAIDIFSHHFGKQITYENIDEINKNKYKSLFKNTISRSRFVNIIVDAYYLDGFGVEQVTEDIENNVIITIYDTGVDTYEILSRLGIDILNTRKMDETTFLLTPDEYHLLRSKAPYLISMAVSDISNLDRDSFLSTQSIKAWIPEPQNEPTIGVIDTMFDDRVYFSKWVEFENRVDKNIKLTSEDYNHGTEVSSIIVDGPRLNPELDDGCGRFRVRHFGVATAGRFSSFTVLREIKEIVKANKDIKVWNLSLGSAMEINPNFISPEAAVLDKIQFENDVVFIVAGTNRSKTSSVRKIGAPADSINSLVVNSVDFEGKSTSYAREGGVLSFYNKPDISYYGGDTNNYLKTCGPLGESLVSGTSFAAPWIARKMSYLIDVLGLSRELAKALIIDSATGWTNSEQDPKLYGYGVVPIQIDKIVNSANDEIKFMISGVSEMYDTYSYNIPIPEKEGKQPFVSKATLCYFPNCSRNQGVDYTNTEMDIHFGRLNKNKSGTIGIKSINDNKQSNDEYLSLDEEKARNSYRKWDNVKHIRENIKTDAGNQRRPKKKKGEGLWGLSIRTKERLNTRDGDDLNFGLVVTLKAVDGSNLIQNFIQQCQFRGWLVNTIDVQNRIDIYNVAEEEIDLE